MAERHAILKSRALATLLNPIDRLSVFKDGHGDLCLEDGVAGDERRCHECMLTVFAQGSSEVKTATALHPCEVSA
jgi:hypothetical protein